MDRLKCRRCQAGKYYLSEYEVCYGCAKISAYRIYNYYIKRMRAIRTIQTWWRECMFHPDSRFVREVVKERYEDGFRELLKK